MKNIISINLDRKRSKDDKALGELLEQAVSIAHPIREYRTERDERDEMRWIARWAIRAVCEEMIRTGEEFKCPLKVRFSSKHEDIKGSRWTDDDQWWRN